MKATDKLKLKQELEKVLWFEIACRASQLKTPDAYEKFDDICNRIVLFLEPYQDLSLSPSDYLDIIFDAIQLEINFFDRLKDYHSDTPLSDEEYKVLTEFLELFNLEVQETIEQLSLFKGFLISRLLYRNQNNIRAIHDSWLFFIEKNSDFEYAFSPYGPIIITNKGPFDIYNTYEDQVDINETLLEDKLILSFDLKKPLPPVHQIIKALTSSHCRWGLRPTINELIYLSFLEQGITCVPKIEIPEYPYNNMDMSGIESFVQNPKNARLTKQEDRILNLLRGLLLWDAEHIEKKKPLDFANELEHFYESCGYECNDDSVNRKYKDLKKLIANYTPDQLPWRYPE